MLILIFPLVMPDNADTSTTLTKSILTFKCLRRQMASCYCWKYGYVCNSTIGPQLVGASVNPIPVVNIFGGNPHSY